MQKCSQNRDEGPLRIVVPSSSSCTILYYSHYSPPWLIPTPRQYRFSRKTRKKMNGLRISFRKEPRGLPPQVIGAVFRNHSSYFHSHFHFYFPFLHQKSKTANNPPSRFQARRWGNKLGVYRALRLFCGLRQGVDSHLSGVEERKQERKTGEETKIHGDS